MIGAGEVRGALGRRDGQTGPPRVEVLPMTTSHHRNDDRPDRCPVCGTVAGFEPSAADSHADAPCPRCGHLLWFISRQTGDVTVVHLIDTRAAVMELLDLLDNAIGDGLIDRLAINFGSIQQVSSAALGKLIKLMNRASSVRGKLKLCGLHPDLRHVFRITRLDRVFDIHETEAEALASFAQGAESPAR
jgi:anti-sigma B factor antagonist